jgi:predicted DNA-binding transcriptional regulator YafY
MPRKKDPDATYGEKLIRLFANLLFARRPHSLTELSEMLNCSKQNVLRLVRAIESSYQVEIDRQKRGKESLYSIRSRTRAPAVAYLSQGEMELLWMCRAFAERLLGKSLFEEARAALVKSQTLLKEDSAVAVDNFAVLVGGTIDYTRHHESVRTLMEAVREKVVCRVKYRAAGAPRAKTFHIKPLKIFSYRDTLYLHAKRAKDPWQKGWVEPEFDPVLAVHRFKEVKKADKTVPFEVPGNYDFEKAFNHAFGLIADRAFTVKAEFTDWAAVYMEERLWSPDQVVSRNGEVVTVQFSSSSEPEALALMLSFGDKAKVLEPEWLVKRISDNARSLSSMYRVNGKRQTQK